MGATKRQSGAEDAAPKLKRADIVIPAVLVAIVVAIYFPVCGYAFGAWDDDIHIFHNPFLNPVSPLALPHFWSEPHLGLYIPITYTAWTLLCSISRLPYPETLRGVGPIAYDARVFHTANLVVHAASTLVCYLLIRGLVRNYLNSERTRGVLSTRSVGPTAPYAAAAGALLFALHPVQVESVAWISELKGLLSGFLALVALDQYVRFRRRPAWWHYAAAIVAYVAALLAKPAAIGLPIIALALDMFILKYAVRNSLKALWPWAVLMAAAAWVGHQAQPAVGTPSLVPLWARPLIAGDALAFYIVHLVFPWRLGLDYGRSTQVVLSSAAVYAAWALPAALAALAIWKRRKWPEAAAGASIVIAAVVPVLGLVPFDFQVISTVADRYLYLALLGPALVMASTLARLEAVGSRARIVGYGVCAMILAGCVARSSLQLPAWKDSFSLIRSGLRTNPRSWHLHADLGARAMNDGHMSEAAEHFQHALRIKPDEPASLRYLGEVYRSLGQPEREIALYRETLDRFPKCGAAHRLIGIRLAHEGNLAGADAEYRAALAIDPQDSETVDALGWNLLVEGRTSEAADEFRRLVALKPYLPEAYGHLGKALHAMGQYAEAAEAERRAIELCPNNAIWHSLLAEALEQMQEGHD